MVALTPCDSAAVKAHGYDPAQRVLVIQSAGGKTYSYRDVPPEVADLFASAGSKGTAWGTLIRGKFDLVSDEVNS